MNVNERLEKLHADLVAGTDTSSDEEVIKIVDDLKYITNCTSAAKMYMRAVVPILARRPKLAGHLLAYPVEPILFSMCYDDAVEAVLQWVRYFLANDPELSDAGIAYLEKLPEERKTLEIVVESLKEILEEEDD